MFLSSIRGHFGPWKMQLLKTKIHTINFECRTLLLHNATMCFLYGRTFFSCMLHHTTFVTSNICHKYLLSQLPLIWSCRDWRNWPNYPAGQINQEVEKKLPNMIPIHLAVLMICAVLWRKDHFGSTFPILTQPLIEYIPIFYRFKVEN